MSVKVLQKTTEAVNPLLMSHIEKKGMGQPSQITLHDLSTQLKQLYFTPSYEFRCDY